MDSTALSCDVGLEQMNKELNLEITLLERDLKQILMKYYGDTHLRGEITDAITSLKRLKN